MLLSETETEMVRIIRSIREVYNHKGYFIVIFFAAVPWLSLIAARASDSVYPFEEFKKFLTAASIMALAVFLHISWWNRKVYLYRRSRKEFMERAKKARGCILQSEEVFLNNRLEETMKRGEERPFWKLKVQYYNEDMEQMDIIYSDYYSIDPLEKLKITAIDVFYEKSHAVTGDIVISNIDGRK